MAIVTPNSPLQHLRGTLGKELIFKRYGNRTVVAQKPAFRKKNSALQEQSCSRFKDAARHAKAVLRDPVKREQYQKLARKLKKHSAYNVIISEYMLRISIAEKGGSKAAPDGKQRFTFSATKKNFGVKNVQVTVRNPSGEEICNGTARPVNSTDWAYLLPLHPPKGSSIIITAADALGMTTVRDFYL